MTYRSIISILAAIVMVLLPVYGQAAPAGSNTLNHDIAEAIRGAAADARLRHLSDRDARLVIQEAIQAAIIQSGAEPDAVVLALSSLPENILRLPQASEAVAAVRTQVAQLEVQSKDAANPAAAAPPAGGTPLLSAPPPSAGSGSGGGSDYRPG